MVKSGERAHKRVYRLGVDLDGVLGDPVVPTLKRLQQQGKGRDLERRDITEWYTEIDDTNISAEIENNLRDPAFVEAVPVIPSSQAVMQQLWKEFHVIIVTNRPQETEASTRQWLRTHFSTKRRSSRGHPCFHQYVGTRKRGKLQVDLDFLIDDHLKTVKKFALKRGTALLFSQPWNEKLDDEEIAQLLREGQIIRCRNWPEARETLKEITNMDEEVRSS
ncbi:MAG: hypothetical protein GWN86_15220 [Desulfobacterales bacterium]|nr:hypothetical protein [Desulfobacterales bacterium]